MAVVMQLDTSAFNASLSDLHREIGGDGREFVRNGAKGLMRPLDIRTPSLKESSKSIKRLMRRATTSDFWMNRLLWVLKYTDRAKAGWWYAWTQLGARGKPRIRNASIRSVVPNEGALLDNSHRIGDPHIIIINRAPHIEELDEDKKIAQRAIDFAFNRNERQLQRIYQRRLSRHA